MSIHTSGFLCEWFIAGWQDITAYTLSVEGDFATTGAGSGIAFGDSSDARATIVLDPNRSGALSLATLALVPVRVTFTVDANVAKGAFGVVIDWEQDADSITLTITGYKELISKTRVYSDLFERRPIATKTTSNPLRDDPTDPDYAAGMLNWILWTAGGRPYEALASFPSATFLYSLSQAPIAPRFSWVAGEDGWEEALRLVRAAGGQLYQRGDGTIRYVSPLSIAGGVSQVTLTQDEWGEISRRGTARDVVAAFTTTYIPRFKIGMTEIVSDSEARVVAAGAAVTIELETQYPIPTDGTGLETATGGTQLLAEAISATSYDGTIIAQGTGYTHTLAIKAQLVTIVVTNVSAQPFVIEKITLRGTPIVPGEAGTVTIGSGTPAQSIEQNPYIQSRSHAQRLARMALAFYGTARPVITATGCLYNPVLQVGMAGTLTQTEWGLTAAPVLILGIKHQETGAKVDYDLVVTTGLPALADYFLVQTAAQSGTKKIGY